MSNGFLDRIGGSERLLQCSLLKLDLLGAWRRLRERNEFVKPGILANFDNFLVRRANINAIREELPYLSGTLLDVGCAQMPYKKVLCLPPSRVTKYIGLDMEEGAYSHYGPFDMEWDGLRIPLADNSVDCAIATEVLVLCEEPNVTLKEIVRVLKPGGRLLVTSQFLWPICYPAEADRCRYTPFAVKRLLEQAGFTKIELTIRGGWNASLAQMLALWAYHKPWRRLPRALLCATVLPSVYALSKLDRPPRFPDELKPRAMITGFSGTAVKAVLARADA